MNWPTGLGVLDEATEGDVVSDMRAAYCTSEKWSAGALGPPSRTFSTEMLSDLILSSSPSSE